MEDVLDGNVVFPQRLKCPTPSLALAPALSLRAPGWLFAFMVRRRVLGESQGAKARDHLRDQIFKCQSDICGCFD
eukprot:14902036-Alexandrium_andersonii.AAC.1